MLTAINNNYCINNEHYNGAICTELRRKAPVILLIITVQYFAVWETSDGNRSIYHSVRTVV